MFISLETYNHHDALSIYALTDIVILVNIL